RQRHCAIELRARPRGCHTGRTHLPRLSILPRCRRPPPAPSQRSCPFPDSFVGWPDLILLTDRQGMIWWFLINSQETASKEVAIFHGFSRQARSRGAAHRSDEGDVGLGLA